MRKILIVLFLLSGMSILARDCIDDNNEKKVELIVEKNNNHIRDIFTPTLNCYLYNKTVVICFSENIGDVTIVISGTNSYKVVNAESTDEMVEIDINDCENGYYTIKIITENQDTYTGEFILQ